MYIEKCALNLLAPSMINSLYRYAKLFC